MAVIARAVPTTCLPTFSPTTVQPSRGTMLLENTGMPKPGCIKTSDKPYGTPNIASFR